MARQIKFDDTLYLKGGELVLDNGSSPGVISSQNGTVKIEGNLTITGTTTTASSATLSVADNTVILNSNVTGTPSENGGIEIERGTSTNKLLFWNEAADKWSVGAESFLAATFEGNLIGNVTGNLSGNVTSTGTSTFTTIDVNGGNIDATTIGATTPAAGTFSAITGDGTAITNVLVNYTTSNLTEGTNKYFTDARIDTHLNQSNPNAGYVLSWNGTDYAWAPNSGSVTATSTTTLTNKSGAISQWTNDSGFITTDTDTTYTAGTNVAISGSNVISATDTNTTYTAGTNVAISGTNVISSTDTNTTYTNLSEFTNDSGFVTSDTDTTYTAGANVSISGTNVISATDTNTTYTNVSEFTNDSGFITSVPAQSFSSLTSKPSTLAGYGITDGSGSLDSNNDIDTHLNQSNPTSGYVLSWNGTDYDWISNAGGGGSYANSDVDTHLNQSNPSSGHVLSWNGSDYAWVANAGGGGSVTPSSTDTFTNKSGAISQWTNDSSYLTEVPAQSFSSLSGKPTTISGYGITDAFDGAYASLSGKPTTVSGYGITDAFDGAYGSLSGTPTIPSGNKIIDWTVDAGTNIHASNYTNTGDTTYTAGAGLTLTGTVFSNPDPDQTVSLLGTGATVVTGTYPNFTINSTDNNTDTTYTAGANVSISGSNVISSTDTNTDTDTQYTAGSGLTLTGTAFSLNASPTFTNITTAGLTVTGAGNITLSSGNDLSLTATDRVKVTGTTPFRLATMTTTERNAIALAENGDTIYNTTTNKFQGYANGAWVDLH